MGRIATLGLTLCGVGATLLVPVAAHAAGNDPQQDKVSATEKGSLVIFSKVEIRWDNAGFLLQDTFLSLTNDYPDDVTIQMYFINGDEPLAAAGAERAHPGWNWIDNKIHLTGDQPTYWSAVTGQPAAGGLSPFTVLDPGFPPGRPNPEGGRMLRGYVLAWAVDEQNNCQIRWNHLKGEGTIVDYQHGRAWEYNSWNYAAVTGAQGESIGTCGCIALDGSTYSRSFDQLLMNFQAVGSSAFSGPRLVVSDTDLTLFPVKVDLRQEACAPVTTKAHFDVWNMNEVKFSGAHRCITCWDQTLLSDYDLPNHFLLMNLQTDHGKARIDGLESILCDVDVDPFDGCFPFYYDDECVRHASGCDDDEVSADPGDKISEDAALLGVVARLLTFDGGADYGAAGTNLVGMGFDCYATIKWDQQLAPPEGDITDPAGLIDVLEGELLKAPMSSTAPRATGRSLTK